MISQISLFHLFESFRGKRVCKELEGEQLTQGIVSNDSSVSLNNFLPIIWKKKKSERRSWSFYCSNDALPNRFLITLCLCVWRWCCLYLIQIFAFVRMLCYCSFISEMLLFITLVLTFCTSVNGVICERIFLVLYPHRLFLKSTGFVNTLFIGNYLFFTWGHQHFLFFWKK